MLWVLGLAKDLTASLPTKDANSAGSASHSGTTAWTHHRTMSFWMHQSKLWASHVTEPIIWSALLKLTLYCLHNLNRPNKSCDFLYWKKVAKYKQLILYLRAAVLATRLMDFKTSLIRGPWIFMGLNHTFWVCIFLEHLEFLFLPSHQV